MSDMIEVNSSSGTPVWDSFDDWVKLLESIGGFVCSVEPYEGEVYTRVREEPWTDEEVAEFELEKMEEWEKTKLDVSTYVTGR